MSLIFKHGLTERTQSIVALGVLAVLTGVLNTGCSSSEPEVVKPVAEATENVSQAAKNSRDEASEAAQPSADAEALSEEASVPVVSAAEAGENAYAIEDPEWMSAAEAGEDAYAVEDSVASAGPTEDECAMRWQDACNTPYVERRQQALDALTDADLTDHNGNVLPKVIPGMTTGMPYAEARQLILADGWRPAEGLDHEGNNNGLDSYAEVAQCSGSGMGLCIMSFTDAEMNRFSVTTWGSGPDVRDWTPVQ